MSTVGEEVSSLYCRFLLNREALLRLERWETFMHELCGKFKLRINVSDTESVGPEGRVQNRCAARNNRRGGCERFAQKPAQKLRVDQEPQAARMIGAVLEVRRRQVRQARNGNGTGSTRNQPVDGPSSRG
jgi:hypothetical protein